MLLLILSGTSCTIEVKGEDQVVAVEAQTLTPVHMGNVRQSDVLAGVIQSKRLSVMLKNNFSPLFIYAMASFNVYS